MLAPPVRLDTGERLSFAKLDLGCGFHHQPGYVSVDLQPLHEPDIVGDVCDLKMLPSAAFEEIRARDVIEHIKWSETSRALYEWNRLLTMEGRLIIQTTYLPGLLRRLNDSSFNTVPKHKLLIINLFSMQKYVGDYHLTSFTERLIRFYLWETGFRIDSLDIQDGWLLNVQATKKIDFSFADLTKRNLDDHDFVTFLYEELLMRDGDDGSVGRKVDDLRSGRVSRPEMIKSFLLCEERVAKMTASAPNFELTVDVA